MSAVDTPNVTAHERLDRIEAIMAGHFLELDRLSRSFGRCEEILLEILARAEARERGDA